LNAVSESYAHYENGRKLADHAMEICSKELLEKNRSLQLKNEMLDAFVARASHDLKAPVYKVLALAEVVQDLQEEQIKNNPLLKKTLKNMVDTAHSMGLRISDLLDLCRADRKMDDREEEIEIERLFEAVLEDLEPDVQKYSASVYYNFEGAPHLHFGRENLFSLLSNLVGNAIKYRSPDREPIILVDTFMKDQQLVLRVVDNGLGIDLEKHRTKLYGMFNRFHAHVPGTGVGLYIIKNIIDKAGGTIDIQSTVGEGTTFTISLPYAKSHKKEARLHLAH
jgi:signal transduction histidine kinase